MAAPRIKRYPFWTGRTESLPHAATYYSAHTRVTCPLRVKDRDRGEPRGSAPPTPPYVRVRIRRFEKFPLPAFIKLFDSGWLGVWLPSTPRTILFLSPT